MTDHSHYIIDHSYTHLNDVAGSSNFSNSLPANLNPSNTDRKSSILRLLKSKKIYVTRFVYRGGDAKLQNSTVLFMIALHGQLPKTLYACNSDD